MTQKFGRQYRLTIQPIDGNGSITIELPFTVNFNCNRHVNASINTLDIEIYNLSEATRARIFQDINVLGLYAANQQNSDGQSTRYFNITLEAGYATLTRIFYGRMMTASSAREGTNIVTRIQATSSLLDLGGTQTQVTLQPPQTVGEVIQYLIKQFPNLQVGAVGNFDQPINRPVVLNGNTWDLLKQYTGGQVYVDNGAVYAVKYGEAIDRTFVINDSTGLLQTPRRQLNILTVTTLLETEVALGQAVSIESSIQPQYNGVYKVIGINHQATISRAVCGDAISTFVLQAQGLFGLHYIPVQDAA